MLWVANRGICYSILWISLPKSRSDAVPSGCGDRAAMGYVLRFGVFELNLVTEELRKFGTPVKLAPQPFQILALLASQAGQVVTREQIQLQLWGEETFVDFEQGMNHCIKQIRTALNDSADTPRYIETLPRRGYRFIAPVEARKLPGDDPRSQPYRARGGSCARLSLLRYRLSSLQPPRRFRQPPESPRTSGSASARTDTTPSPVAYRRARGTDCCRRCRNLCVAIPHCNSARRAASHLRCFTSESPSQYSASRTSPGARMRPGTPRRSRKCCAPSWPPATSCA